MVLLCYWTLKKSKFIVVKAVVGMRIITSIIRGPATSAAAHAINIRVRRGCGCITTVCLTLWRNSSPLPPILVAIGLRSDSSSSSAQSRCIIHATTWRNRRRAPAVQR